MKYVKNYKDMNDAERFFAAITDTREYLGAERFDKIIAAMRDEDERPTFSYMRGALGFIAGVEGYPVTALYQYAFGFDADVSVPMTEALEIIDENKKA